MSVYTISLILGFLANQALAGCVQSTMPDCDDGPWLNSCPKGIPKKWACLEPDIAFPTVECIEKDLRACGTLGKNRALLYSYGATTVEVRTGIRDNMDPRPVMFNDALPDDWHKKVAETERFGLQQGKIADPNVNKRNDAFVNRFSAAITKAAYGDVLMVTRDRNSRFGGSGAYSLPDPSTTKENVWRTYEFPVAQRNPDVERVISFALEENSLNGQVDYERGKKGEILPMPTFPDPPLHKAPTALGPVGGRPVSPKPAVGGEPSNKRPGGFGRRPLAIRAHARELIKAPGNQ